ncbi:MAG: LutC/YkgG family protein [Dermatophilaceae bacterium]
MTSPRDTVLGAVRAALGPGRHPVVPIDRAYREHPVDSTATDVVDLFVERVADYRASIDRCTVSDLTTTVARSLGEARSVVIPPDLGIEVPRGVVDGDMTAPQLDRVDAVVTRAAVGIAETGTIVLDHGPGQGRRALSLVPDLHICIVRADQVVASVVDAVGALDPARPQTWVSGPSATSDIELTRVEGVHGPRTLHVVLLG